MEPLHKPHAADQTTRRKSTLGIITKGLHTVKLPEHGDNIPEVEGNQHETVCRTSSDRSSRWESIRRRIDERKFSTELQTKNAHRIARRSIKQAQRQRRQSVEETGRKRSSTVPPVVEERTPKTRKRNVSFEDVQENHNDVDLGDVAFKEQKNDINGYQDTTL